MNLVVLGACLFSLFYCALVRKRKKSQKSHQMLHFPPLLRNAASFLHPFSTKTQESRNATKIVILTFAVVFQRALVKHENKQALGREVEHSLTNLSMHGRHSQFNV
jgi:hypothetical protein